MLCSCCKTLNLRQMFEEAEPRRQPRVTRVGDRFIPRPAVAPFHFGLLAVYDSARAGCDLCIAFSTELARKGYGPEGRGEEVKQLWVIIPVRNDEVSMVGVAARKQLVGTGTDYYHPMCKLRVVQLRGSPNLEYRGLDYFAVPHGPDGNGIQFVALSLKVCMSRHKLCNSRFKSSSNLPTRVIDVGPPHQPPCPRLFVTQGQVGSWIALSYCWGASSPFVLKEANLVQLTAGLPLGDLPATLRDAIDIVHRLGQRYLWIDALCIIQDSPDDWSAEAARMRYVYANAVMTLSAGGSPDSSAGILTPRTGRKRCSLRWDPLLSPFEDIAVEYGLQPGVTEKALHSYDSLLASRGWCLQEALLSTRNAVFLPHFVLWECATVSHCEGDALPERRSQEGEGRRVETETSLWAAADAFRRSHPSEKGGNRFDNHFSRWCTVVASYSQTRLTVESDILPALGGLAQEFYGLQKDQYCAGLWKKDIVFYMLWARTVQVLAGGLTRRPSTYLSPSWSWAATKGPPIKFYFSDLRSRSYYNFAVAKVYDITTESTSVDEFGRLKSGSLKIEGQFKIIDLSHAKMTWTRPVMGDSENVDAILESIGILPSEPSGTELFRCSRVPPKSIPSSGPSALERRIVDELKVNLHFPESAHTNAIEFLQQFRPLKNCHFAALQLARWSKKIFKGKTSASEKRGVFILLLQSAERDNEYRRVGLLRVADGVDPYSMHKGNDYPEIMKEEWKKKTVTII